MSPQVSLSSEFVTTFTALELPHPFVSSDMNTQLINGFEGLPTDVAVVRATLLVLAGHVTMERSPLRKPSVTDLTAKRPLTRVGPIVFVQTRLDPESLPTQMTLEWFLPCMRPQMHIQIALLGEPTVTEFTNVWPFIPVLGLYVHLQAMTGGSPVTTLLTHKQLLSLVSGQLVLM